MSLIARLVPTLFEDRRLLVVSKPAGVDVGAMAAPGGEPQRGMVEILAEVRPELPALLPVNRLSRFESGVLILAKTADAAASLRAQWKDGGVEQEYVAVVVGRAERRRITLGREQDAPSARAKGRGKVAKGRSAPRSAVRPRPSAVGVAATRDAASAAESATTSINVIHQGERRAAVRCRTNAPNTHILRAQLRSARLRVLGDHLKDPAKRRTPVEQTFLHLARVSVPVAGEKPLVFHNEPASDPIAYVSREFDVARFLHAALVRRLPLLLNESTDCFRLITGPAEGLRGVAAEKFGEAVILQVHDERAVEPDLLRGMARWYREALGIKTALVKSFAKGGRSGDAATSIAAGPSRGRGGQDRPLLGPPVGEEIVVTENGLRFAIRLTAGQSAGLFLDQRDNRRRIREISAGKDVLNLFAYTCGFSVAAAAGGARHTASVDISPKHLDWGRRNFELNGIDTHRAEESASPLSAPRPASPLTKGGHRGVVCDPDSAGAAEPVCDAAPGTVSLVAKDESDSAGDADTSTTAGPAHLFFKSDAADFLKRAKRQGRAYDIIILDAPSFAHARGKGGGSSFSIERDLSGLVRGAVEVLRPGGTMLISTNYRQLTLEGMRRRIREGAGHRKLTFGPTAPLPIDFAADPDHAKSLCVRLD